MPTLRQNFGLFIACLIGSAAIMSQFAWVPLWDSLRMVADVLFGQFLPATLVLGLILAILLYVNSRSEPSR